MRWAGGSFRAELQTLPTPGGTLVFIYCRHCDSFPIRWFNQRFYGLKEVQTCRFAPSLHCADIKSGLWAKASASPATQASDRGIWGGLGPIEYPFLPWVINQGSQGRRQQAPASSESTNHSSQRIWPTGELHLTYRVYF